MDQTETDDAVQAFDAAVDLVTATIVEKLNLDTFWRWRHDKQRVNGAVADIENGKELTVSLLISGVKVTWGEQEDEGFYHWWEYNDALTACAAVTAWDGEKPGDGWVRTTFGVEPGKGLRRRPDGTPESEEIR